MSTFVYGDSRARQLKDHIPMAVSKFFPGKTIGQITDLANQHLASKSGKKLLYIVGGICNLTKKLNTDRSSTYEEVVFQPSPNVLFDYLGQMQSGKDLLAGNDCVPIYCTVPTMSLKTWNEIRLAQKKTSYLQFESQYVQMQEELNSTILQVNKKIVQFNFDNGYNTPHIHQCIMKCKKGKYWFYYNRYVDGVHPDDSVVRIWAHQINNAIVENYKRSISSENARQRYQRQIFTNPDDKNLKVRVSRL
ncbi:unnamed protein product [Mytilus coruscus]|uniref:Uncharacterized protein n=1 Tax=Mytilus coruscus TaxID=42192 RepID=A0A6J8CLW6_MYTCO|nr:unnamed protein product [Mytilus coruscus]